MAAVNLRETLATTLALKDAATECIKAGDLKGASRKLHTVG